MERLSRETVERLQDGRIVVLSVDQLPNVLHSAKELLLIWKHQEVAAKQGITYLEEHPTPSISTVSLQSDIELFYDADFVLRMELLCQGVVHPEDLSEKTLQEINDDHIMQQILERESVTGLSEPLKRAKRARTNLIAIKNFMDSGSNS